VPDHIHVEDTGFVEALDDVLGGDADGGDEETGAGVDDDGYELVEFAFGVVVALRVGLSTFDLGLRVPLSFSSKSSAEQDSLLRLPRTPTNLRDQEIHPERRILVLQESLQLRNLLSQHVWCVADAADDAQAAGIGDRGSEFGTSGHVHSGEHDGVVDF